MTTLEDRLRESMNRQVSRTPELPGLYGAVAQRARVVRRRRRAAAASAVCAVVNGADDVPLD